MGQLYSLVVIMHYTKKLQKKKNRFMNQVFLSVFHCMDILFLTIDPFSM